MHVVEAGAVVLDFDGTLLDSFGMYRQAITAVFTQNVLPVPSEEVLSHNFHGRLRESIGLLAGVDGDLLDELHGQFMGFEQAWYEEPEPLYFPDALNLLERNYHEGLDQIIVTNRMHVHDENLASPRLLAERQPLARFIGAVVCGDDHEFYKPDARVLEAVERRLCLNQSELVVVGDQAVDALLAHNIGARAAVLVSRDGSALPHMETVPEQFQDRIILVRSLDEVTIKKK